MPIHDPQRAIFIPVLIPLGTTVPRTPWTHATYALIGLNLAIFGIGLMSPGVVDGMAFFMQERWYRYVSYAFVHEPTLIGLGHVFFNMLFLWIFAGPLETRIGWWRITGLYLICAIAGAVCWSLIQGSPNERMLGSSAAVWGIVAAYLLLWPASSVKFFFTVLLLVTPLYARAWKMRALVFAGLYYAFLGGMMYLAWFMDFKPLVEHVAWSAHAGGIAAGIALTAAAFAVKGSGAEVAEPEADEPAPRPKPKQDEPVLGNQPQPAEKPAAAKPKAPAPAAAKWLPLHEAVMLGDRAAAIRLWHEHMKPEPGECLMPGPQLDLARMLAREGRADDAIEALDRLLRIHPRCELATMARLQLAKIMADHGRNRETIAALLDQIENGNPAVDIIEEVEELRGMLSKPHVNALGAAKVVIEEEDLPGIDEPIEPPDEPQSASVLFGNPEDTDAFEVRFEKQAPEPRKPDYDDTTPPADVSKELAKFGTAGSEAAAKTGGKEKQHPRAKADEVPFFNRQSILPQFDQYDAPDRVMDESLEPLDELEKTHVPSPEIFIGDITQFPYKPDSEETEELPLVLRPTMHYAAILTPGRPVDIQLVCSTLAPMLGLGPETTHHALLRRRGILIEDLVAAEAEALARTLSTAGQSVSLVAMDKTLDFGPPLDVMTYHDEGPAGRFSVAGQALMCRWSQAVCFAAGLVRLDPTAPGRAVLDLFFSQPRAHLRLWESTMVYPDKIVATAKVLETIYAQAPSEFNRLPLRRDWCFRAMSNEIGDHGKNAIRTRSLSDWLEQAKPLPTSHFWSPIEYDNFLRWHLMAYYAPRKVYS